MGHRDTLQRVREAVYETGGNIKKCNGHLSKAGYS